MFFERNTLDEIYPEFHADLLSGRIDKVAEKLQQYPALAKYSKSGAMPPVLSAIYHSFRHQHAPAVLLLLAEYHADFNVTYYIDTHYKFNVNCDLNPLAWLILHGGDARLLKMLVNCGTDKNHHSIATTIQLINANNREPLFSHVTKEYNSYELAPKILAVEYDFEFSNVGCVIP